MSLNGVRILLIGAGGLLGKDFAKALIAAGANVMLADKQQHTVDAIQAELGHKALATGIDITHAESINGALALTAKAWGAVDAVVNTAYPRNARYGKVFEDVAYNDFCENLNLHLGGYFLVMQQAGAFFRHQGGGHIVNIASIYGVMAPRFEIYDNTPMTMPVEYAAIKSGLIHLSRYVAKYLKDSGVRVNCLSPGGIFDHQAEAFVEAYAKHTGTIGMLAPQDISAALVFLLSPAARGINGQNLVIDDGFTL